MVFQYVVMLICNAVLLEELFQSPAAESTRLGVNVDIHDILQS
jgi:hypothetical protein|tara:strand:+ start:1009 stop:1137 length:129 start_codon:yes stop_codon:yes gene_type:complete